MAIIPWLALAGWCHVVMEYTPETCQVGTYSLGPLPAILGGGYQAPFLDPSGGSEHMHSIAPAPTLGLPPGVPIRHVVAIIMPTRSVPIMTKPSEGSERSEHPERARRTIVLKRRH